MLNNVSTSASPAAPDAQAVSSVSKTPAVSTSNAGVSSTLNTSSDKTLSVNNNTSLNNASLGNTSTSNNGLAKGVTVTGTTNDSFSMNSGGNVNLLGNMPGQNDGTAVDIKTVADPEQLDFFPTNENTVLFASEGVSNNLALQVAIADGSDPNFNAALAALAAQNPEAIVGMLEPLQNGTYKVNLFVQANNQNSDGTQLRQLSVQVTDGFLPANLPQDAQGNTLIWAALINKAYAKLLDQGAATGDPLSTVTGRQVTVLGQDTPSGVLWQQLSLANPPLKVPVTAMSNSQDHRDAGIEPDKAFNVTGTFVDGNGEKMVSMQKPGLAGMLREASEMFSIPLSAFEKAILTTIIADGRPGFDLVNPQEQLHSPNLASCCQHTRVSGGALSHQGRDTLRVFDRPTRLQEQRCLSCAFARSMCQPE